ncbi:hypothetical protein VE02_00112 [Pseudogymnoascus sp. 03VT05]|nr:hypothetical protein VE02_00112 [Pseudogymnoascus sp. 03VT05]
MGDPTPECNMGGDLRRECGLTPHISVNTDVDHNSIFVGKIGESWPSRHHPLTTRLKCYRRDKVAEEIHMICGIWIRIRHDGIRSIKPRSARMNMNSYRKASSWLASPNGAPESSSRVVGRSPPPTGTPILWAL